MMRIPTMAKYESTNLPINKYTIYSANLLISA